MNFTDTLKSVELVLATGEVPLIVGESGIGKTALAKELAAKQHWSLIVIDGNLLKEGEIGGLPTIETSIDTSNKDGKAEQKTTVYAVHHKLRELDRELLKGNTVLLFIDELNRCEHTVQQELMNLILNREINGYQLYEGVKIIAAMNPSGKYGSDFDYQVVDMDAAQENRFVWLHMEPDHVQWLQWAMDTGLEQKVIEFIATFPEYLHKINEDDIRATPRSYERISKAYHVYKDENTSFSKAVFFNVIKGNVGNLIAEEFMSFIEANHSPLVSYEDVFAEETLPESVAERIHKESHTRLYLLTRNILKKLEAIIKSDLNTVIKSNPDTVIKSNPDAVIKNGFGPGYSIDRLIELLKLYPVDLRIGIMKDIKNSYPEIYRYAIETEAFVDLYFESYGFSRE